MSAFEVSITPKRIRQQQQQRLSESRSPTEVVMAPFSAKSIVQFEDVPVSKIAKRIVQVFNPFDEEMHVSVSKKIRPEHNITMEWTDIVVPANECKEMELVWQPQMDIVCKESIQLTNNHNFTKEIAVILKTKPTQTKAPMVRKYPTLSSASSSKPPSYVKTLRLKSPTNNANVRTKQQQKEIATSKRTSIASQPTKAAVIRKSMQGGDASSLMNRKTNTMPLTRSNHNNIVPSSNASKPCKSQGISQKENRCPVTPESVYSEIDKMNFTPVWPGTVSLKTKDFTAQQLVSMPTPTPLVEITEATPQQCSGKSLRRRRLLDNDLQDDPDEGVHNRSRASPETYGNETVADDAHSTNHTFVETNATYVINPKAATTATSLNKTETFNESISNANIESLEEPNVVFSTPMIRVLNSIKEESRDNSHELNNPVALKSLKPPATNANKNLKRDIKLIGQPLRKHFESMQDLSFGKPTSNKVAIQGSMPNLNGVEALRSIEQNRYFKSSQDSAMLDKEKSQASPQNQRGDDSAYESVRETGTAIPNGMLSQKELNFNKNEIAAQSSVYNLNEIGLSASNTSICDKSLFARKPSAAAGGEECNRLRVDYLKNSTPYLHSQGAIPKITKKRSHPDISFSESFNSEFEITGNGGRNESHYQVKSPSKRKRLELPIEDNSVCGDSTTNTSSSFVFARPRSSTFVKPSAKNLKLSPFVKKSPFISKVRTQPASSKLYDSNLFLESFINPDPFAATTTCDPFLASTMYLDASAVEEHQQDFRKWLNALVTTPTDLDTDCQRKIDVGKLFSEVRNKELTLAPTKEQQSKNYLTNFRLESLRHAAIQLYFTEELRVPCSKVAVYINKSTFRIREDRNLHLDVVLQRYILELLLCFNPLWLRLGLEVVYGEKIHLQSNDDIAGLSWFIVNRLFRDKLREEGHSKAFTLSTEYSSYIKKFTLQKFLFLLLFLDKAKCKRIIKHNPCLFLAKSPHKETKEILLKFSSELLANVGDVTRDLKRLGYVLSHKQMFLDEFNYAFNNLAVDLRDGIRLTRVMEIILLREDLTTQLRAPAISRLQRIFNVNLALRALKEADFELRGNITAADIVDGHREKTLSLLWQIIYKFRSPKFHAAARSIQMWWRRKWLQTVIKRRIHAKQLKRREDAATKIQAYFRSFIVRRKFVKLIEEHSKAATVLQKYIRGFLARRNLQRQERAAVVIQRMWSKYCETKSTRSVYLKLRQTVIKMQQRFRANKEMRRERHAYLEMQRAAIVIQKRFRANKLMIYQRQQYLEFRKVVILLQQRRRSLLLTRRTRAEYLNTRKLIIAMQRRVRNKQASKRFLKAVVCIQCRWRAQIAMRRCVSIYQETKAAIISIQIKWRATLLARQIRVRFLSLQYYTKIVQQKFRATQQMRLERQAYLQLKHYTIAIQRSYRGKLQMRHDRDLYQRKLQAVLVIQRRFKAYKLMRYQRAKFQGTRNAVTCIQQRLRAYLQMKKERTEFLRIKQATIILQSAYRGRRLMLQQRTIYQEDRMRIILLQRRFRAKLVMRKEMQNYARQRGIIIAIQQRYRAKLLGRKVRQSYLEQRTAIIKIQQRWRAKLQMRVDRREYLETRMKIIKIQRFYRRYLRMKAQRAATKIQQWIRSIYVMREQQKKYQLLRTNAIVIQQRWRATLSMIAERKRYYQIRDRIILLQQKWRATLEMRVDRAAFLRLKKATLTIQVRYRSHMQMLFVQNQYIIIRSIVILLQRKFRANKLMHAQRNDFLTLRNATVYLQQKFRGHKLMLEERSRFTSLRESTLKFQAQARGFLARQRFKAMLTPELLEERRRRNAAKLMQKFYRGYRVRKRFQDACYRTLRQKIARSKETAQIGDSLRNKLKYSVGVLRGRCNMTEILKTLDLLDRMTRCVPHLVAPNSMFIISFCYGIMDQAIRSEFDKKMILLCARIILNLGRYEKSPEIVFQRKGFTTISQMLLRWCDKDCDIFNTLCTLIWLFAQSPEYRKILQGFMTTQQSLYTIREVIKLVARKEKMKSNDRRQHVVEQSLARQKNFSSRALPSLKPDYGIIQKKPYIFISSVFAFETILHKLGIDLY